ncbi:unnamed protein product [Closterium sp. NIES-65]|nr:unnamed protein product [Closterium sp. NIES-65]
MAESYCNRARTIRAELLTIGQEVHMATFAAHVLKGLPPEYGFLRRKLEISSPDMTMERVCSEVLMEEQTLSIEQSYKQIKRDASAFSGAVNTTVATTGINGKEGKGGREQTDKKKDGKREKKRALFKGRCYNGNEEGHMAAKCSDKKKDTMSAAAANVAEGDGKGVALTGQQGTVQRVQRHAMARRLQWHASIWRVERRATAQGLHRHATASNGTAKEIADVASSKPEAKDGAASLKMYAVGSKATPNLWHARLGHVHFDAVKRTATSGGVFGMDLEKGGEDMPCTSCHEAKLTRESFPLHDERVEQVLGLNPPPPRTVIVVPVPSVQGGEKPLERSVGPLGSKAPTATPPLGPPSIADSAPVGPEDGPLEVDTSMADYEEEEEVAVDEQSPMAHEHEPSPAVPPFQPIPPPPCRSSRPNKGVPPVQFQPLAMTALDADDEDNPYDVAYLAEDECDTDSDDEVEYPDEDEEEEGAWGAASEDQQLLQDLKGLLAKAFQLREVEPVERYLGLQIEQDRPNRTLLLHQNAYVAKVQQRFFKGAPPKKQPITPLSSASFAKQDARQFANRTMTETVSAKALVMVHTSSELETF